MKTLVTLLALGALCFANAQTIVTKTYPVKAGQEIKFKFDYPENIRISTWDRNEISIQASVTINNGKDDSSFVLDEISDNQSISISNKPFRFKGKSHTIVTGDKNKTTTTDNNNNIDILIEIKVPANMLTRLKSTYGMVELKNFDGPADITATYGGIDASLSEKETGTLSVLVNYGQIYSDLSLTFTDKVNKDFHTSFKANYGTGAALHLESGYGNIYLRKAL